MLNYIFEFEQTKLLEIDNNLSSNDVIILHYIITALTSDKTEKLKDNSKLFVWISYDKMLNDLPLLNISKQRLYHLILNYVKLGLLEKKQMSNDTKGSKCFICITEKLLSIINHESNSYKTLVKNDKCNDKPPVKNDNSYNTNNSSSKLLSKDNNIPTTKNNYEPIPFKLGETKPKKKNLYQSCLDMIYEFTNDLEIQSKLIDYLDLRLEMKDKPPLKYKNQWKGILSNLNELANDKQTILAIINQSIVKGWANFFELKSNNYGSVKQNIEKISDCTEYKNEDQSLSERRF